MKKALLLLLAALCAAPCYGQINIRPIIVSSGPPTGGCTAPRGDTDITNQAWYFCGGDGVWHFGGGAGGGTVTSLSQGTGITLTPNPITTTGTIANAGVTSITGDGTLITNSGSMGAVTLTTPTSVAGNVVYGNMTGTPGAPGFGVINASQIAAGTLAIARGGSGTGSTLTGLVRGGASAFTAAEVSGDCTTSGSNAITCTKTNGVSFAPSATTDTTNATNITSGTLPNARLVAVPNSSLANSSLTANGFTCTLGSTCTVSGATNTQTGNYTAVASDNGKLIVMNCSSACTLTLPNPPPSAGWYVRVETVGSSNALVSLNSQQFNGATAVPVLQSYRDIDFYSDGTNYWGRAPLAAGNGVSITGASNSVSIAVPTGLLSCAVLDNAICTSSVDGSGNPNFLAADATPPKIDINGGTTSLILFIAGYYQILSSNVTVTPATPGADTAYFIYAKQDTSNASMVAGDFGVTNIVPNYQYTAPTCSASATSTNPHIWYDLSINLMKFCTSNGGAFSAQAAIVLGEAVVSSTPTVLGVVAEPYRLNPYKRYEVFGSGTDGSQVLVSGTTTVTGDKQYSVLVVSGSSTVLSHLQGGVYFGHLRVHSQNPILVVNSGAITLDNKGGTTAGLGTGAGGNGGNVFSFYAPGGGGGGFGTNNGGTGGGFGRGVLNSGSPSFTSNAAGGTSGTPTGGTGANANTNLAGEWTLQNLVYRISSDGSGCSAGGGNGGGDGTNNGGSGGGGGGCGLFIAPSIYVASGASVTANGQTPSAPSAGNTGGGGGGAGGFVALAGGFVSQNGTFTATHGSGAAAHGTGGSGGPGGDGTAIIVKLW